MSRKGGGENEASGGGEGIIVASAAVKSPTRKDDFIATDDFMRLLRGYVDVADLFHTFRLVSKPWQRIAEEKIDQDFESGELFIHDGDNKCQKDRKDLVKRMISLLNITKIRVWACYEATNLVVVHIPEGVESIGDCAFSHCHSLTNVSFPTTLTSIGACAFYECSSLDNVDLFHTNFQELGKQTFWNCSELTTMTIPDSLQTLGEYVFWGCSKLVSSNIHIHIHTFGGEEQTTKTNNAVVAYLRSQQL